MSKYHLPEWAENIPEGWHNEFPSNDIYACVYNTESARCIRISLGLTQKDLALCLGLKPQYINSVEKGARAVSSRMLQALLYLGKQQRLVGDIVEKSGSMVVKEHGFYKLQDDDGGVVYVPAKWLAAAVGRASIEHGKPLALSEEQNSNPADWHDKNT